MGTSDYSDLAEQPLAPFKHGTDVLISATTNRPIKEAGIKPHVYWCETCKIKLTHAMSAIAHFAGTFHLKNAGFLKESDGPQQTQTQGMKCSNPASSMQFPEAPHMNNAPLAPPAKIPRMDGGGGFAGFVAGGSLSINKNTGSMLASAALPVSSSNPSNYHWSGTNTTSSMGNGGSSLSNQKAPWESGSSQGHISDYRYENPCIDNTGQSSTYQNIPEHGVKSYSYQDKPPPRNPANPYSVLGMYSQRNEANTQYTNVASRYRAPLPMPSQPDAQQTGNTDVGKAKARAERVAQLESIIQQMSGSNIDPSIIAKLNIELAGLKNSL